jgi:hypothetical protein
LESTKGRSDGVRAREFGRGRGRGKGTAKRPERQEVARGGTNPQAGPERGKNPPAARPERAGQNDKPGPQNDKPGPQNDKPKPEPAPELGPLLPIVPQLANPPSQRTYDARAQKQADDAQKRPNGGEETEALP